MKALLLSALILASASAEEVTLMPSQDSDIYHFLDRPSSSVESLNIGAYPGQVHSHHSLLQFNLSTLAIPAAEIGAAKLRLYSLETSSFEFHGGNVSVHRQGTAWAVNSSLLWTSLQPLELAGTMAVPLEDAWVEVDVTTLVKEWHSGTKPNHGFVLKPESETAEPWLNIEFASMELPGFQPKLIISRAQPAAPAPPVLGLAMQGGQIHLSWSVAGSTGWTLQEATSLSGPWTASGAAAASNAGNWEVTLVPAVKCFYRLYRP